MLAPNGTVEADLTSNILSVVLSSPERLNAANEDLYTDLHWALDRIVSDVRVLTICGEGRAFCAGADLKRHAAGRSPRSMAAYLRSSQELFSRLNGLEVPIVTGVHGYALGAGAELALSGDMLVVGESTVLGFPEIELGTFVGGGVSSRLARAIGPYAAARAFLLGERFDALALDAMCIAYEVCADDEVRERTYALGRRLSELPERSIAFAKEGIRRAERPIEQVLAWEERSMMACFETPEWKTGLRKFQDRHSNRER